MVNCRYCADGISKGGMKSHLKWCEYNTEEERARYQLEKQRSKSLFGRIVNRFNGVYFK